MVDGFSSVPKNHHVPAGGSGNVPLTSWMRASTQSDRRCCCHARQGHGRSTVNYRQIPQDSISLAGISSRLDKASHAAAASSVNIFVCSTDHESSRKRPQQEITALNRHWTTASDSQVCAGHSIWGTAASMRCFRKTLDDDTSKAQKPVPRNSTNRVLDIRNPLDSPRAMLSRPFRDFFLSPKLLLGRESMTPHGESVAVSQVRSGAAPCFRGLPGLEDRICLRLVAKACARQLVGQMSRQ